MKLSDQVRLARRAFHWTQAELARRAGVSQQLITKIENGQISETRKLPKIAAAFGITSEFFVSVANKLEMAEKEAQEAFKKMRTLTEEETRLIDAYRAASPELKSAILAVAATVPTDAHARDSALLAPLEAAFRGRQELDRKLDAMAPASTDPEMSTFVERWSTLSGDADVKDMVKQPAKQSAAEKKPRNAPPRGRQRKKQ